MARSSLTNPSEGAQHGPLSRSIAEAVSAAELFESRQDEHTDDEFLDERDDMEEISPNTPAIRFKDGRFTSYTTKEGMFSNGVFAILEDNAATSG